MRTGRGGAQSLGANRSELGTEIAQLIRAPSCEIEGARGEWGRGAQKVQLGSPPPRALWAGIFSARGKLLRRRRQTP